MIDIEKGRYWDLPLTLVSSCTRVSPGCRSCWALAMEKRFHKGEEGKIRLHPERLSIPLKRRKPTVYAVWNDLFHEDVPEEFQRQAFEIMREVVTGIYCRYHVFLVLTKRPQRMKDFIDRLVKDRGKDFIRWPMDHVYLGLTVVNQAEADEKIPIFLQVPGKKFLSVEPQLEDIDLSEWVGRAHHPADCGHSYAFSVFDAVLCGGETGPGARPMHPDWVRSVRDQCATAGVDFFFKSWGKHVPDLRDCYGKEDITRRDLIQKDAIRLLDGRTHDYLPWLKG